MALSQVMLEYAASGEKFPDLRVCVCPQSAQLVLDMQPGDVEAFLGASE